MFMPRPELVLVAQFKTLCFGRPEGTDSAGIWCDFSSN
jgi:hypothetical protein